MEAKMNALPKLIHAARIQPKGAGVRYLFLKQMEPSRFAWHEVLENGEVETSVSGLSVEEAIYKGRQHWKYEAFRTVICGFRYTLPERDEHGNNALFYQMAASYSSPNGIYFDEELGHNCFVHFASQEALTLWRKVK